MSNPAAVLNEILEIYDDLDPAITTVGSATMRKRPKLLRFLQHVHDYVHNFREWSWTYKESTVVSNASSPDANLPTDFLELGESYWAHDVDRGVPLVYIRPHDLARLRAISRSTSQRAIFSIFNGKIQLPYNAGTTIRNFTLFHRFRAPVLADDATEFLIPDKYVSTVIIPGVVAADADIKNDAREKYAAQFTDGLSQMAAIENPAKQGIKPPLAIKGAW